MVDLTDRVALRKNDGSDPFLRDDFTYNWDRLDDYPGYFPCTAGTHPTWGVDQAGLLIHETDTGKVLRWTGSAFVTPNIFPKVATFTASPAVSIGAGVTYTQAMGSFTPPRTCGVLLMVKALGTNFGSAQPQVQIDASNVNFGPTAQAPDWLGYATGLSATSHALSVAVTISPSFGSGTLDSVAIMLIYLD